MYSTFELVALGGITKTKINNYKYSYKQNQPPHIIITLYKDQFQLR